MASKSGKICFYAFGRSITYYTSRCDNRTNNTWLFFIPKYFVICISHYFRKIIKDAFQAFLNVVLFENFVLIKDFCCFNIQINALFYLRLKMSFKNFKIIRTKDQTWDHQQGLLSCKLLGLRYGFMAKKFEPGQVELDQHSVGQEIYFLQKDNFFQYLSCRVKKSLQLGPKLGRPLIFWRSEVGLGLCQGHSSYLYL